MTRQEAIKELELIKARIEWEYPLEYQIAFDMAIKVLERKPKRGKWINREYCQVDEDAYEVATCSNCKAEITLEYPYDSFCPNCGARME